MTRRGSIMAEFVLSLAISAGLLAAGALILQTGVIRHRALAVADFAARIDATPVPRDIAAAEIADFSRSWLPGGDWRVTTGRFRDLSSASFYDFRFGRVQGTVGAGRPVDERVVRLAEGGGE